MLCDLPTVQQAAVGDGLSFDPFPFDQNGLAPPEVDVGGRQVGDALVISQVIVVGDEGLDLGFEFARQVIVLEQDAVLERLMPALCPTSAPMRQIWRVEEGRFSGSS